ncbi:hypothetical protein UlMin_036290 [Ulmus minor]
MHEYTMHEEYKKCQNVTGYYALCKVFKKSGAGPKNGEQYGAPFIEEDWADDDCSVIPHQKVDEVNSNSDSRVDAQLKSEDIEDFIKQLLENENAFTLSQVSYLKAAQSFTPAVAFSYDTSCCKWWKVGC